MISPIATRNEECVYEYIFEACRKNAGKQQDLSERIRARENINIK